MNASAGQYVSGPEDIRRLFSHVIRLKAGETDPLRDIRDVCPTVDHWRALLSLIPLDKVSFHLQADHRRTEIIDILIGWCREFRRKRSEGDRLPAPDVETYGYLCILLITLVTLAHGPSSARPADVSFDRLFGSLLEDGDVRLVLCQLYEPSVESGPGLPRLSDEQRKLADTKWHRIQQQSLRFHRRGSTSFILSGDTDEAHSRIALKLVLFPYSNIPVIADKTLRYTEDHGSKGRQIKRAEHMVDVWASTTRWILMDFADGRTLAEEIEQIKQEETGTLAGSLRLDLIRTLGIPLLDALHDLSLQGKRHDDLSPTNIIVKRKQVRGDELEYEITFIDFGRNYLYTGSLSGLDGPERAFVAPEVRDDEDDVTKADLYSLGKVLIALGDVGENRDSIVPDRFYDHAPLLARLLEDLVDEEPSQRLLVFQMAAGNNDVYSSLAVILKQELDVTQAALEADSGLRVVAVQSARQPLAVALHAFFPISRELAKRRRIYRVRKKQQVLDDPRRSMYAGWLLGFSIASSINFYIVALICFYWLLRDLGASIFNPVLEAGFHLIGARSDSIPLIDSLRHADYHIGEIAANLPARMVGLSFALVAIRYYQNILSGITTRTAASWALPGAPTRIAAECAMRVMSIWSSWLILGCNLVEVRWWPLCTAIGYSGALITNITGSRFVRRYVDQARSNGLSTVPPQHQKITGLDTYLQWVPKMSLLVFSIWPTAVLIYLGVFKDVNLYTSFVVVVNIGLLYIITTGISAPDVRIGLNRCYLAAERLRYRAERTGGTLRPTARRREPVLAYGD